LGEQLQVIFREEVQSGEVAGLDDSGALLLRDREGKITRVIAGDATIKKG
jgi:BirA family biotin operon repressor/biotin-[acetyl-CoA-carboxylase] ligase